MLIVRKWIRIIAISLLIIIILNYNSFLNIITSIEGFEKYEIYTDNELGSNREIITATIILIIILAFRKLLVEYDNKNQLYIFMAEVNYILLFTGFISPFIKRIALYFGISNIFLLASLPQLIKIREQKILIYMFIILYGIGMFTISTYVLGQSNIIPYQTIFGLNK